MNKHTDDLYRRWRELCETGYGKTGATNPRTIRYVDDRIRRAKAAYERSLELDKAIASRTITVRT